MTALEHSKPVRMAHAALHHALADDWPKVRRVMERLSDECKGEGVFLALCAWIDAYVQHSTGGEAGRKPREIVTINAETGSLSTEGMPPEVAWAARAIHARSALDHDAFDASLEELPEDPAGVGLYVGAVLRCVALTINGLPSGYANLGRSS